MHTWKLTCKMTYMAPRLSLLDSAGSRALPPSLRGSTSGASSNPQAGREETIGQGGTCRLIN